LPRLWIAVIATVTVALGLAPAAAQATVTSSSITSWTSSQPGTPANAPYLISFDNASTTIRVTGTANAASGDLVDIDCFSGSPARISRLKRTAVLPGGTFDTGDVSLKTIAGHACRLRAVPANGGAEDDDSRYAAAQIAVSEADLPVSLASGPNLGAPFNYYVNAVTFNSFATWTAAGTPSRSLSSITQYPACGGPSAAPIDANFNVGTNFALDCVGSLLSDDLGAWGGRSEVQVDGHNAYDPAAAASPFANLGGFPKTLSVSVKFDPTSGLVSSTATEPFVFCSGTNLETPTAAACVSLVDTGVTLQRTVTTSDDGRVITMTDTWHSSDGAAHTVDLLYDDVVGVQGFGDGNRGWQFPGQAGFTQYGTGASAPAPTGASGSILVRTDVTAPDGDPSQASGAITFDSPPAGFRFASNSELEEHRVLPVPAGGTASLTYVYSLGSTSADAAQMALAAQDQLQPLAVTITSPGNGSSVSSSPVTVTGTAVAGSGIGSITIAGQTVPVEPNGSWSANVALNPGSNALPVLATDAAGISAQGQLTVVYQPPTAAGSPPVTVNPVKCRVPRTKGMKLPAAERALRRAHCRVGRIKHVSSKKLARGRVMGTTPHAGRRLAPGAKVALSVSKGA
jgi:hypothetical protein